METYVPEMNERLDICIIPPDLDIASAVSRLDRAGTGALLVCSHGRVLEGLVTDGDFRRALLQGIPFTNPIAGIASAHPVVASPSTQASEALHLMNVHDIHHLPLVDAERRVIAFVLRRDLTPDQEIGLSAVVMAGGFGTRLRPLTDHVPKPLLPVGDRPLLEHTIERLRKAGIRRVNLTTHYLADSIVEHFGSGERFGVDLNYVTEDHPLGTAGGIRLMEDKDEDPLLVINGDILSGVPFREMLTYHKTHRADLTVGVRKYDMQVPYGVVECEGTMVSALKEKPSVSFYINAGMYLIEPSVRRCIPENTRFDMTDLIQVLLKAGKRVVSFPIVEYWLDVGQHADYERAQEDIRTGRI